MTDDEIREYLQDGAAVCHDMINVLPNAIAHRQKHLGIIDRLEQKDARIAALSEELERERKKLAAIRQRFDGLSKSPEVSAIVQQAFMCVVFAIDYPDKVLAQFKEPTP